jgi:hypothetical protein
LYLQGGSQTVSGTGQIVMGVTDANAFDGNGDDIPDTLTFGPNITVRGQGNISSNAVNSIVNQGTVSADVGGGTSA